MKGKRGICALAIILVIAVPMAFAGGGAEKDEVTFVMVPKPKRLRKPKLTFRSK